MGYLYLAITIFFTVYGQLILKWRIGIFGALPAGFYEKLVFFKDIFLDIWVISGLVAAVVASVAWMATLTKFDLSFAYPFMSLAFVIVFFFSVIFFQEVVTWQKIIGIFLVVGGLVMISK